MNENKPEQMECQVFLLGKETENEAEAGGG